MSGKLLNINAFVLIDLEDGKEYHPIFKKINCDLLSQGFYCITDYHDMY